MGIKMAGIVMTLWAASVATAQPPQARAAAAMQFDAEEVTGDRPAGFGMYVGAGKMSLAASAEKPHGGKLAARLTLEDWHRAEGKPDQISGSLLVGGSNGYQPAGALPAPDESIALAYEIWARGNVGSVNLRAWCWDQAGERSIVPAEPPSAALTDQWQPLRGRFALPGGTKWFALGVGVSANKDQGATLGWLEVDDASITPLGFPQGELRAVWWGEIKAQDKDAGIKEIDERLTRFQSMGLNAVFYWISSLYLATLQGMPKADDPQAAWDAFGELLKRAHGRGIQVHVWYSPWIYKGSSRAIELRIHPEWAAVNAQGKPDDRGVCLARPEVRALELELLTTLVTRHPELDGIHLEEPGYPWGDYCYCDYCKRTLRDLLGLELTPGAQGGARHNWAAFCATDFTARLREMLCRQRPQVLLSANGSAGANPDWYIGRDWTTWARRGYLDFYVPQVYTESVEGFQRRLHETQVQVQPWCRVVPGIAVTWSGIYPRHNKPETLQAEIRAARKASAAGFTFFEARHITDEEVQAIKAAISEKRD